MRRFRPAPLLLACFLALATGLALLAAASLVTVPAPAALPTAAPPGIDAANSVLVRRFYDAVNATLRTGDPAPLADVVAADFADRAAERIVAPTRDGLVRQLLDLHTTFPAIRLAVEDVQAHGDWVLARVRVEGAADGTVLGIPLSGGPARLARPELLRIAGGRIAERWAAGDWPVPPMRLAQGLLTEPPESAFIRLARLIYAPGSSLPRQGALGPLLLAVEAGTLTARLDGPAVLTRAPTAESTDPSPATVPPGVDVTLSPGDGLLISPGVRHEFRNDEQSPAAVLVLALLPWHPSSPEGMEFRWPAEGSQSVAAHLIADGLAATLPACPATLALGRVALTAGAGLTPSATPWSRVAIVEAGTLGLAGADGTATLLAKGPGTVVEVAAGTVLRGTGDGPLTLLLLTIAPAAPSEAC
jgi:predicted ester cyclase